MNLQDHASEPHSVPSGEQAIRNFLYCDGKKTRDFPSMKKFVDGLTAAQAEELKALFRSQVEEQEKLTIAPQYVAFLNEVHKITVENLFQVGCVNEKLASWKTVAPDFLDMETGLLKSDALSGGRIFTTPENQRILTDKGRAHLDQTGFAYDTMLDLMRVAAQAVHDAWGVVLGKSDTLAVTKVLSCDPNDKFPKGEMSLLFDVIDNKIHPYYRVGRWSHTVLDPRSLLDVAVHEPEHAFQERIKGFDFHDIPKRYHADFGVMKELFRRFTGICPSWVLSGLKDDETKKLVRKAYLTRPCEMPAFYQGLMMGMAVANVLDLPVRLSAVEWFRDRPLLAQQLPQSLRKMIPTIPEVKGRSALLEKKL